MLDNQGIEKSTAVYVDDTLILQENAVEWVKKMAMPEYPSITCKKGSQVVSTINHLGFSLKASQDKSDTKSKSKSH